MVGLTVAFDFGSASANTNRPPSWVPRDAADIPASFFLDATNNRGWFDGRGYTSEAALLTAVGGTKTGITYAIGPFLRGPELVSNGSFDADVAGWTANTANAPLNWDNGKLKITNSTGATTAVTAYQSIAMDVRRAYQAGYKLVSGASNSRLSFFSSTTSTLRKAVIPPNTSIGTWTGLAAARPDCAIMMFRADSISNGGTVVVDDITVREVVPFKGWNVGGYRQRVSARTPASISATQVLMVTTDDLTLAGASGNTVQSRVRLEYRTDNSLHLIVTSGTTQQADMTLGTVALDTDFSAELRIGLTTVSARLNGDAYSHSGMGNGAPGVAKLRIGHSSAGENWTGTIYNVGIWTFGNRSIRFEGDSYIGGAGGVSLPLFYTSTTDRLVTATGVGGSDMDGIKSRMLDANNKDFLPAITVFWDGSPNGLTTVTAYCDLLQDCISALGHGRFVVIPPAIGDNTLKTQIRDEMLLRWPGNIYDWRPYILNAGGVIDATRFQSDGAHLNATGMAEATAGLKVFLDLKGW